MLAPSQSSSTRSQHGFAVAAALAEGIRAPAPTRTNTATSEARTVVSLDIIAPFSRSSSLAKETGCLLQWGGLMSNTGPAHSFRGARSELKNVPDDDEAPAARVSSSRLS